MPDWLDGLIKVITFVFSAYAIMSAFAAKRSAEAAEKQASSAAKQAHHAETQAEAAEAQVDLMRSSMTIDRIGTALKGRRAVMDIKDYIREVDAALRRMTGGNPIHAAIGKLQRATAVLADFPPVYPAHVRAILFGFVQQLDAIDFKASLAKGLPVGHLTQVADELIAAMDVAITAKIDALKD